MNRLSEIEMTLNRFGDRVARDAARSVRARAPRCGDVSRVGGTELWRFETWPGNDQSPWFRHANRPALIVSEPYHENELQALRAHVWSLGLELHNPANPFASLFTIWNGPCLPRSHALVARCGGWWSRWVCGAGGRVRGRSGAEVWCLTTTIYDLVDI